MKLFSKKDVGNRGERIAARFLHRRGCKILARNYRCGRNELDIVAKDGRCILFAEVKTLTFASAETVDQHPAEKVDAGKRRRTVEAAREYLRMHPTDLCPRLDVIEVYLIRDTMKPFKINHIPDAFSVKGEIR